MDSLVQYIGLLAVEVRTLRRSGSVELGVLRAVAEMMTVGQPIIGACDGETCPLTVIEIVPPSERSAVARVTVQVRKDGP